MQDVEPDDFRDRGGTDADLRASGGAERQERRQALLRREFLGIVQQSRELAGNAGGKDDRRRQNGAGEWSAPDLVHSGHTSSGLLFQREVRHTRPISRTRGVGL